MRIQRITDVGQLQSLAASWDCLAHGVPFRSFAWTHAWWRQFAGGRELYCLAVFDDQQTLVGLLPLLRERSLAQGTTLRFLGNSRVAAGYPSLLTTPEHALPVTQALTEFLCQATHGGEQKWDHWLIEGENTSDRWLARLIAGLAEEGHGVTRQARGGTWQICLPSSWDEYSAGLSANHRRQLRKAERRLRTLGDYVVRRTESRSDLRSRFNQLLNLHAHRQTQRHGVNRFQTTASEAFLRETLDELWQVGQGTVFSLEVAGQVLAADLVFCGGETAYAYLAGWNTTWARYAPGNLLQQAVLQQLIRDGYRTYDLLDSPANYARHWRGHFHPSLEIRVQAQPKVGTPGISIPGEAMRAWLKTSITLNGMR
jgi:CelD/BcsL family acetyltransferase involved in cellulose biosynthesis